MPAPTRRGLLNVATAFFVALGPVLVWCAAQATAPRVEEVAVPVAVSAKPAADSSAASPHRAIPGDNLLELAKRDPIRLVRLGKQRYEREVKDYRCVLIKQERIEGKLSPVEEIEVRFRKSPPAVFMIWKKNAGEVQRALYCPGKEGFIGPSGEPLARIEPAGSVVRLFVRDIFLPIHGERANKVSRRTIDECGFGATFRLFEEYNAVAAEDGVLKIRFAGTGEVDGRPTFVLERELPYEGEGGRYPDARMVMHVDQKWLLPVAIESYADREGQRLLGRYVFTKVELNPGLTDADFAF